MAIQSIHKSSVASMPAFLSLSSNWRDVSRTAGVLLVMWSRAILADVRHVDSTLSKLGSRDGKVFQRGQSNSPASRPRRWSIFSHYKEQLISLALSNMWLQKFHTADLQLLDLEVYLANMS